MGVSLEARLSTDHAALFPVGSGHEWGGLHTEITNHHPSLEAKLLYLDMIPWFCRVYIHTLQITNGNHCCVNYEIDDLLEAFVSYSRAQLGSVVPAPLKASHVLLATLQLA